MHFVPLKIENRINTISFLQNQPMTSSKSNELQSRILDPKRYKKLSSDEETDSESVIKKTTELDDKRVQLNQNDKTDDFLMMDHLEIIEDNQVGVPTPISNE